MKEKENKKNINELPNEESNIRQKKDKIADSDSSHIKNAHATGDGAMGRNDLEENEENDIKNKID